MRRQIDKGIKSCKTISGLASIQKPATELVIWERSLPAHFQTWIDRLDATSLPDIRILVKPEELCPALTPLLDRCGLTECNMRNLLVRDINELVANFSEITQSEDVDVRLQRIDNDACWKFHRDTVETRLITTYRGPTTEWVQHAYSEQAIQEQREFNGPLERLKDGDVAIFKGNCSSPDRGIVHRSPPISSTGVTRLLLCLNKRTEASPDPWAESYLQ